MPDLSVSVNPLSMLAAPALPPPCLGRVQLQPPIRVQVQGREGQRCQQLRRRRLPPQGPIGCDAGRVGACGGQQIRVHGRDEVCASRGRHVHVTRRACGWEGRMWSADRSSICGWRTIRRSSAPAATILRSASLLARSLESIPLLRSVQALFRMRTCHFACVMFVDVCVLAVPGGLVVPVQS